MDFDAVAVFVKVVEARSFSGAARLLKMPKTTVSAKVAALEQKLGTTLLHRTTRSLSLTEAGERLFRQVRMPWTEIGDALAELQQGSGKPAGTLKVAMGPTVSRLYFLPLLDDFLQSYTDIVPDLHFDNRQVDLIAEGFDVAIGGGVELTEGLVACELARVRIVPVAAPAYLSRHGTPADPGELTRHRGLLRRALATGRLTPWILKEANGDEVVANVRPVAVLDDPEALAAATAAGLGIAMLPMTHALPMLRSGELVRILPA